jgi:hypothetical protein
MISECGVDALSGGVVLCEVLSSGFEANADRIVFVGNRNSCGQGSWVRVTAAIGSIGKSGSCSHLQIGC